MDNKVGDNAPEHEKLSKLLGRLQAVVEELRAFGVTLDDYDRKRLLHPRTGSDAHVTRVLELARKYSVVIPATPLDGIANDVRLAAELPPFEAQLASAQRLILDTQAQAQSEYWEGFLAYYGALSAMARSIPELAAELQPVVDFMATGKRQAKKPALPGPSCSWSGGFR